jgi:hypothetical protein
MFVQVIEGKVSTGEDAFEQIFERWEKDVRPGAVGFVGSTGGLTDDGTVMIIARFADEASARANNDRPEQTAFWQDTSKTFTSEPSFRETTEVDEWNGGGDDRAGFVQVMIGTATDKARYKAVMQQAGDQLAKARPDLLGTVTYWFGDDYVEVAYFESEAAARAGESQEMTSEMQELFSEFQSVMGDVRYVDLRKPHMSA